MATLIPIGVRLSPNGVKSMSNYWAIAINQVLTGEKTPEEAMAGIKEPVREIMKRAGYYDK